MPSHQNLCAPQFDSAVVSRFYSMVRCTDIPGFTELLSGLKAELAWLEQAMDPTGRLMPAAHSATHVASATL